MTLPQRERLSLGSAELDKMMGGGLIKGSATLVSGAPGVGKTTLGLQFLISGIQSGQTGLMVSFEVSVLYFDIVLSKLSWTVFLN